MFNTLTQANDPAMLKSIYICQNCGNCVLTKRQWCDFCDTANKRLEHKKLQNLVKQENLTKGFNYK
jgi:hypothetical protein